MRFFLPESEFSHSQYADMYTREKLSAQIKLPEDTIKVDPSFILSRALTENHTFILSALEMIVPSPSLSLSKVWFSNRRAKWRREAKHRGSTQRKCVCVCECTWIWAIKFKIKTVWSEWKSPFSAFTPPQLQLPDSVLSPADPQRRRDGDPAGSSTTGSSASQQVQRGVWIFTLRRFLYFL